MADRVITVNGNYAAALAFAHSRVAVVPTFPITPSTSFIEMIVALRKAFGIEVIQCVGENDVFTAMIAASAYGVRSGTGSNSQGLLFAYQQVCAMAGMRRPVVIAVATRTTSAPLNIWGSHEDAYKVRDSGCIMLFAKNIQEIYYLTIMAFRIAEHMSVRLPVFVCYDGFTLSHTMAKIKIFDPEDVAKFVGKFYEPYPLWDPDHSYTHGAVVTPDGFTEVVHSQVTSMQNVLSIKGGTGVFEEVSTEFARTFGVKAIGLTETHHLYDDTEYVVVVMGGNTGVVRAAVNEAREIGLKVGMLSMTSFRPFPVQDIRTMFGDLKNLKNIAVLDRGHSIGATLPPLASDIRGSVMGTPILPCVYGLGGRNLTSKNVMEVIGWLQNERHIWEKETTPRYIGALIS